MSIKDFLTSRHPQYIQHKPMWEKMYNLYRGEDELKNDARYLWKYEREAEEDWQARGKMAAYENHLSDIITRQGDVIFGRAATRDAEGRQKNKWEEYNDDIDLCGTVRSEYVKECFVWARVFGWLPVMVDQLPGKPAVPTRAGKDAMGIRPYWSYILPFDFLNWNLDQKGNLDWGLMKRKVREWPEPFKVGREFIEYRVIDREKVEVWEEQKTEDGKTKFVKNSKKSYPHGLGRVPIEVLYDRRASRNELVGIPSLLDSANKSLEIFNLQSWQQDAAYKTLFSQMVAPKDMIRAEQKEINMGPGYVFFYNPEGSAPAWIAPPVQPIETLQEMIDQKRLQLYKQAKLDEGHAERSKEELSGVAYTLRRKPTEDMAVNAGEALADWERRMDYLMMAGYEGDESFESKIEYPKRYSVRATQDALEQQKLIEESKTIPPEVKAILASKIVSTEDFADLSDTDIDKLEQLIKEYDPEKAEVEQTKRLKKAEVDELIPLEQKRIESQKQHAETIAANNVEREKIRQQTELERLKHEEKLKGLELEQKLKEAQAATEAERNKSKEEKVNLWG